MNQDVQRTPDQLQITPTDWKEARQQGRKEAKEEDWRELLKLSAPLYLKNSGNQKTYLLNSTLALCSNVRLTKIILILI